MLRAKINPNYHVANRPHFDEVEVKGGGDAVSAARAVLQTGEYDYAWNMQVEDDILKRMEQGGRGKAETSPSGNIEHIQLNSTDPWTEVDGEHDRRVLVGVHDGRAGGAVEGRPDHAGLRRGLEQQDLLP